MEVAKQVRASQYTAPRTILGFFLGLAAITVSGAVLAVHATKGEHALPIVGFAAAFLLLLLGVVGFAMFKVPMALMLGEVKGSDYLAHQRLTRGDSMTPEYTTVEMGSDAIAELGEGASDDDQVSPS